MAFQERLQRVDIAVDVVFRADDGHFFAKSANLSESGMCVVTNKAFPAGAPLHIVFGSPPKLPRMSLEGIIRWAKEREGIGIEFTSLTPEHRQTLQNFLNSNPS